MMDAVVQTPRQRVDKIKTDLDLIIAGKSALPNPTMLDPGQAIYHLTTHGDYRAVSGVLRNPDSPRTYPEGAIYYLKTGQFGLGLHGSGIVLCRTGPGDCRGGAYRFALCRHTPVESRSAWVGWHPRHCTKCGLNLSYDSSG